MTNSMLEPLEAIVSPKSVAVIGASNKQNNVGNAVIRNLIDSNYHGVIYPVNLSSSEILGIDINPLLVFEDGKGCMAIDARIVISNATL